MDLIEQHEGLIRLSCFLGMLIAMGTFEALWPKKTRTQSRLSRWVANLSIVVCYTLLARLIFPFAAMGLSLYLNNNSWGLLNILPLPLWLHITLSMVILDMAIYWQHVASHKIPLLWQFHKVHHTDRDIDVTTGIRFHPVEIIASTSYKMLIVALLGPHVLGVLFFEILLNASAMFNHANVRLPAATDKIIRALFVTPDMHRVHHSVIRSETDSNYGFNLSLWDRLFNTYITQPQKGHQQMTIGLPQYQTNQPTNFLWCLALPFRKNRNSL